MEHRKRLALFRRRRRWSCEPPLSRTAREKPVIAAEGWQCHGPSLDQPGDCRKLGRRIWRIGPRDGGIFAATHGEDAAERPLENIAVAGHAPMFVKALDRRAI